MRLKVILKIKTTQIRKNFLNTLGPLTGHSTCLKEGQYSWGIDINYLQWLKQESDIYFLYPRGGGDQNNLFADQYLVFYKNTAEAAAEVDAGIDWTNRGGLGELVNDYFIHKI